MNKLEIMNSVPLILITNDACLKRPFMKKIIHKADTRGRSCNNWLKSFHTFSCDEYYDAERINFGALRVLTTIA